MTAVTRRRRHRAGSVDRRLPDPVLGPHVYLLHRLDAHLTLLQRLRADLVARRTARPGARLQAAAATALAAEHYAADIADALGTILDGDR